MKPDTEEYHWGRNVLTAKLEGVDYPKFYLFSTKEHTYVIFKQTPSKVTLVRDTTEKIFANLLFLD
jgi:hypothetical protein